MANAEYTVLAAQLVAIILEYNRDRSLKQLLCIGDQSATCIEGRAAGWQLQFIGAPEKIQRGLSSPHRVIKMA